jgi:hypothetical protein
MPLAPQIKSSPLRIPSTVPKPREVIQPQDLHLWIFSHLLWPSVGLGYPHPSGV